MATPPLALYLFFLGLWVGGGIGFGVVVAGDWGSSLEKLPENSSLRLQ